MGNYAKRKTSNHQCNSENVGGRLGAFKTKSRENGNVSNQIPHSDSTWGSSSGEKSDYTKFRNLGGALSQLRKLRDSHLAHTQAKEQKLKKELKDNEAHRENLLQAFEKIESILKELGVSEEPS